MTTDRVDPYRDRVDPYRVLGVSRNASLLEIARARRRLAKEYHPDVARREAAAEEMRRINAAWELLSDPASRAAWDVHQPGRRSADAGTTWTTWAYPPQPPTRGQARTVAGGRNSGVWVLVGAMVLMISVLAAGIAVAASRPPGPDPAPWLQENLDR